MAIRNNLTDVNAMSTATKAILYHSVMPYTPSERRPWPGLKKQKVKLGEKPLTEEEWEDKEMKRMEDERIRHEFCYRTEEKQHQYCPRGDDSWCKWQKEKEKEEREKEQTEQEKE